jgi:magnesium-transporting ATPase (P-type)
MLQIHEQHGRTPGASGSDVYETQNTGADGLTKIEAQERLELYGTNTIERVAERSLAKEFLGNFTHLMALLLWIGGGIAFLARMPQLGVAIWMVNLINGGFSFWQEYRAERATAALLGLLPPNAHVIRDGQEMRIPAEQLVPGDIVFLEEGDHISADARIISAFAFSVDESTLTGESRPVRKSADLESSSVEHQHQNLTNVIYAGTSVLSGTCRAIVLATGMGTRFGKIAHLTQSIKEDASPLQKEMSRVTKAVTLLATSIGAAFFLLAVFIAHINPADGFVFAMGMIVAFVPEGMLPTVSLALALAVQEMAKRNALVKRLSAVETLGCTSVICTDKTGTITQNQMTVERIWVWDGEYCVSGTGYCPQGEIQQVDDHSFKTVNQSLLEKLLIAGVRCNNARLIPPHVDVPGWSVLGDPTEGALLVAARKGGLAFGHAHRICEFPFDSHRKRMSAVYDVDGARVLYLKGAPAEVISRCIDVDGDHGKRQIDDTDRALIITASDRYARQGLRVLALADRVVPTDSGELTPHVLERDLTFRGLVAMLDPPHEGVPEAVAKCHQAGIKIVMITGDDGLTAESIARHVGIITNGCRVVHGSELDTMDEVTLHRCLESDVIFARVAPEHKLNIVSAFQDLGHIVAVTGDGVNDAPALRKADIGIAMGVAGSDVAKESADMILTDDNFASIVSAVELGRAVYANIRKFAIYVFNSNMAEALPFIVTLFSRGAIPLPLTVMQVLSIDLGTDMVPALGLGTEAAEAGIMSSKPRSLKAPLLDLQLLCRALLWYGLIEATAGLSCYFFSNLLHGWPSVALAAPGSDGYRMATTMTVMGIVAAQIGAVLCCRTERASLFTVGPFSNRLVLIGIATELLLLLALMHVPVLQNLFNTAPVSIIEWTFALAWTPAIILLDESRKFGLRLRQKYQST